MLRSKSICLVASLMICAACSSRSERVQSAPLAPAYQGVPAGLMARCVVHDVPLVATGDIVESRARYKDGFEKCAAKVDAIRDHDAKARNEATSSGE